MTRTMKQALIMADAKAHVTASSFCRLFVAFSSCRSKPVSSTSQFDAGQDASRFSTKTRHIAFGRFDSIVRRGTNWNFVLTVFLEMPRCSAGKFWASLFSCSSITQRQNIQFATPSLVLLADYHLTGVPRTSGRTILAMTPQQRSPRHAECFNRAYHVL